ncbi:MAG: DMT(drug/metabolite transporter) superfamily permease [Thermoleophilia bacterium]|nr:DMT(drug/metabolite transporter) superfamily permease [Thermoleophilia bacterium]
MNFEASAPRRSQLVTALLATWLIWGSTFLAIHLAVESIPPLLMMGSRFVAAGLLATLVGLYFAHRTPDKSLPTRRDWGQATIVGIGLVTIGMGVTGWAATRMPTGIAALLVASAPLWVAGIGAVAYRTRLSALAVLGLLVGMAGVGLLVLPTGDASSTGAIDPIAALVLVLANAAWAAASLYSARTPSRHGLLLGCGMQLLTGGVLLMGVGVAVGELGRLDLSAVAPSASLSWVYLVTFGSIIGFLAYGWLLERTSTSVASTHAFVNPLVAVALGAIVLNEQVGERTLLAAAGVVVAVILLLAAERSVPEPALSAIPDAVPPRGLPARTVSLGRPRPGRGWTPTPTPEFAFAARRAARPDRATDGMDALEIDAALDWGT